MTRTIVALIALSLSMPLPAQDSVEGPRANHYLDHLVLGINDLDTGMDEVQRLTGVRPKFDGRDAQLGTHSAVIGLGDMAFLEIMAPDPEADSSAIDAELKPRFVDRLANFDDLTPFLWAIGTGNLEKTRWFARRAGSRTSDIRSGSRKRSWGRTVEWLWVGVDRPESRVMPLFVQWHADTQAPQERAPDGCELTRLEINTRNFKSVQTLLAAMQIDADPFGADDDSMRFTLECEGREVVFEPVSLIESLPIPRLPERSK